MVCRRRSPAPSRARPPARARALPPAPAARARRPRPPARPPGVRAIVAGAIVLRSEIERAIVLKSQTNWPIVLGHAPHCSRVYCPKIWNQQAHCSRVFCPTVPISQLLTIHQNAWFQVWIFKKFLGRGSLSPSPDPLPRSISGFAFDSRALRVLGSGCALNSPLQHV